MSSEENSFSKSDSLLPPAPNQKRIVSLVGLTFVGVIAWGVAALLYPAAHFATQNGKPRDLGALALADLERAPGWVEGFGTPRKNALSFERYGTSGSFRLSPLEERPDLWILLPVPKAKNTYVPPTQFSGRLVRLSDAGPMLAPVVEIILQHSRAPATHVLLEGQSPRTHRPSLLAALLLALLGGSCLSFAAHLLLRSPSLQHRG